MIFRPYPSSLRAIWDLERLANMDGALGLAFLMSPRSAYILQNLVAADVMDLGRYAVALADNGYFALQEGDGELDVFDAATDGVRLELIPMSGWINFIPRLYQAPGNLLDLDEPVSASYLVDPRGICDWVATLSINEAGSAGDILIQARTPPDPLEFLSGDFLMIDAGSQFYEGAVVHVGSGDYKMIVSGATSYLGSSPSVTLADGDVIWMHCRYRCEVS